MSMEGSGSEPRPPARGFAKNNEASVERPERTLPARLRAAGSVGTQSSETCFSLLNQDTLTLNSS